MTLADRIKELLDHLRTEQAAQDAAIAAIQSGGGSVPTQAATNFTIPQNTQVLFAEPISMPVDAWIEVQGGAVLREVC